MREIKKCSHHRFCNNTKLVFAELYIKFINDPFIFQNNTSQNILYGCEIISSTSKITVGTSLNTQTSTNMAKLGRFDPKPNHNNNHSQKINLAFADRLKPACSQRSSMSPSSTESSLVEDSSYSRSSLYRRAEQSRNNPHGSPTQHRAKAIIRKYRRHVRQVEFKRLRSIVPAVANNEKASQVGKVFFNHLITTADSYALNPVKENIEINSFKFSH